MAEPGLNFKLPGAQASPWAFVWTELVCLISINTYKIVIEKSLKYTFVNNLLLFR